MSDTPRTNFVAHETGDSEWDRSINRFGRMMVHACILERELAAAQAEIAELSDELADKRKFCYQVEQALSGLNGDYIETIDKLRKECGRWNTKTLKK